MYPEIFFSKEELQNSLNDRLSPIELNRVICAYEMVDVSIGAMMDDNNYPLFFKCTRYARILIEEIDFIDPDVLITALLFTAPNYDPNLNNIIIGYNFGAYAQLMCDLMNSNVDDFINIEKLGMIKSEFILRRPEVDYYLIALASLLDKLRVKYANPDLGTINFLNFISQKVIPAAEKIDDKKVMELTYKLKQEKNKFTN